MTSQRIYCFFKTFMPWHFPSSSTRFYLGDNLLSEFFVFWVKCVLWHVFVLTPDPLITKSTVLSFALLDIAIKHTLPVLHQITLMLRRYLAQLHLWMNSKLGELRWV